MAGEKEVKLVLTAEDNITSTIKKVTEYLGDTGMGQAITAISTSFDAVTKATEYVVAGFQKVYDTIAEGAASAANAENVNKQLAMSMASVGQYTEDAFLATNDWAAALKLSTGESAEALKGMVSLGLQMGMTADQAKNAATAALDLAAATGQDMNSAFRQIGITMSGSAGKLEKFIPELRGLTKEELENGAAIDIIAKKYDGFAKNMSGGYTGALKKFDNSVGDVWEAIGRMISQNPAFISALEGAAKVLTDIAGILDEVSTFVINNAEDIKILAVAFGIASTAVGAYIVYLNSATIATVALRVGTILLNSAMALTPWGLAIAAIAAITAGLYLLWKNIDLVVGVLKVGLGITLQVITAQLSLLLTGIAKVVSLFNADWAKSIESVKAKMDSVSDSLIKSGQAQIKMAQDAKKSAQDQSTSALMVQRSTEGIINKIKEEEQELLTLQAAFSKSMTAAKTAFDAVKDLMPRMKLEKFQEDAENWKKDIDKLRTEAEALKVKLSVGVQSDEVKAQLDKIDQQIRFAEEAQKAVRIKNAMEIRQAVIKEEEIRLQQMQMASSTAEQQIMGMRLEAARNTRGQLIEIETQRMLAQRGLASAEAQEGISIKQAAALQANDIELNAYRAGLEAKNKLSLDMELQKQAVSRELQLAAFTQQMELEKKIAVDFETQKQLAIAQAKAAAMTEGSAGAAGAKNDVEIIQAQAKAQELASLRAQDLLNEQQYQQALTELRIQQISARTETEVMLNQQKQELLGTSPEAMALALENEKIKNEAELLMLQEKLGAELITEQEFTLMKEEAMLASAERQQQIKEQMITRDIQQNERLRDNWAATLGKIRLEQEKHGQIMGMIKGIQQSKEYAATQGALSDLASLRSSSDRKAFEAGKAAAIAQAVINTFFAATSAYSAMAAIPIVGPALGVAAAAAAIAAGMNNVSQIKSQKFQGGAHGGIDEVPKSMNNSTFVLKAGERVVQPDQNKDLGEAVDKINEGGVGGHSIYITIAGDASDSTVEKVKQAVMDGIREASERGTPIMHEKGIVRG